MEEFVVYVRADAQSRIVEVQSSEFLHDPLGWTEIDRGEGPRYAHAQANYFPQPIVTEDEIFRYKLVAGFAVERTPAEMEADRAAEPEPPADGESVWDALDEAYREGVDGAYDQ